MFAGFRLHACLVLVIAPLIFLVAAGSVEAQQPPSNPIGLTVQPTIPGSDTTPPVISSVTASSITSSAATITWTTNEASDSRVDYGPTIYSSASPVNASLLTTHVVTLSGLSQATMYHYRARSRDAAGNLGISGDFTFATSGSSQLSLAPQDTSLNINTNNYSSDALLTTYTWPDNQIANAILMKFDLSSVPAGAVVLNATLQLALAQSDGAPEATYTITAHKVLAKNPVIAAATGYTSNGTTPWTPNACCSNNVPMAQADISLPYDTQAIDKVPGYKSWTMTTMVQEWLSAPATNLGLLLNSDVSKLRDRYRYFASTEHVDPTLRPFLSITYTIVPDVTPPVLSAVAASAPSSSSATINWTTNEASDSQVEYGTTTAYGSTSALNTSRVTSHTVTLSGLVAATMYHYHVRSRDAAGNLAVSGDFTFTTAALDLVPPTVSVTAPSAGATVSNTVAVSASASDNVGVVGVQFKLDGANLGAEDTAAPYSISWNTAATTNGSHVLTATARDAAGNQTSSLGITVTISNVSLPGAPEPICPGGSSPDPNVLWCDNFEAGDYLTKWDIGSNRSTWPASEFVKCASFGFNGGCAAWTNYLLFDNAWGYYGYNASDYFPPQSEFYIRFYQYVSNPYTFGSLEDKSVILHDVSRSLALYIATNRSGGGCDGTAGTVGQPAFINYQDRDWPDLGGVCTKVNRFQNQGNDITLQPGKWYLFEAYVKFNTIGANDGIVKLWIDDASGPITTQTLRLYYTDMRFLRTGDAGKQASELQLTVYDQRCDNGAACAAQLNQSHKWDQIVISKAPIGPIR